MSTGRLTESRRFRVTRRGSVRVLEDFSPMFRITEDGKQRVTEDGHKRIVEQSQPEDEGP